MPFASGGLQETAPSDNGLWGTSDPTPAPSLPIEGGGPIGLPSEGAAPTEPTPQPTPEPTAPVTVAPTPSDTSPTGPGVMSVDALDPIALGNSMAKDVNASTGFLEGLSHTLFGSGPDNKGGLPILSDIAHGVGKGVDVIQGEAQAGNPIAQGLAAAGAIPGGLGDTAKNVGGVVGGVAEAVPANDIPFIGPLSNVLGGGGPAQLAQQFQAAPDSAAKQAATEQAQADPARAGHILFAFMTAYHQANQVGLTQVDPKTGQPVNAQFYPEGATAQQFPGDPRIIPGFAPAGSTADDISNFITGFTHTSALTERPIAGAARGQGMNRLQEIMAIGDSNGQLGYDGQLGLTTGGLSDMEQLVYQNVKGGVWTGDQALNFLTAAGGGFSHNQALEIGGQTFLDPQMLGTLGAGGLSKFGRLLGDASKLGEGTVLGSGNASRLNPLAHLTNNPNVSAGLRALGQHVYTPIMNSALGDAARIGRLFLDPFHILSMGHTMANAGLDVTAEMAVRQTAFALGPEAYRQVVTDLTKEAPEAAHAFVRGEGTASMIYARQVLGNIRRDNILSAGLGLTIKGEPPSIFGDLLKNAPPDIAARLQEYVVANAKTIWGDAERSNLADRMAAFFGEKSPADWLDWINEKAGPVTGGVRSTDALAHLHAATFGEFTNQMLDAIGRERGVMTPADYASSKLDRLSPVNVTTLTDLAVANMQLALKGDDLVDAAKLAGQTVPDYLKANGFASLTDYQREIMLDAQGKYGVLKGVKFDPTDVAGSVRRFSARLDYLVEQGGLPSQLIPSEIAALPKGIRDIADKAGDAFVLAYRPTDDKRMGLIWDRSTGDVVAAYDVWNDPVGGTAVPGRAAMQYPHNVVGMPIIGEPLQRLTDYLVAGAQTLTSRATSAAIQLSARGKYYNEILGKVPGLTKQEAELMWNAIHETAQARELSATALSESNMWKAAERFVPDHLRLSNQLTERSLMQYVVSAYQGDLRFIGLTQAFSRRAKALLADVTKSNFAGQVSEDLYQHIRFKNPLQLFQVQRRVESVIFSASRGVQPVLGLRYSKADRIAAEAYSRMGETGLNWVASLADQAELDAHTLVGQGQAGLMSRIAPPSTWQQIRNARGANQLAMLRVAMRNQGVEMRAIWEAHNPGEWDKVKAFLGDQAGHRLSDDEVAAGLMHSHAYANDIRVNNIVEPGATFADFTHATHTQVWHSPHSIGEVKPLELDRLAQALALPRLDNGRIITTADDLTAALRDKASGVTMDRLKEAMSGLQMHADYIKRVQNAVEFDWVRFWGDVGKKYNVGSDRLEAMQRMISQTARERGMTGVEYLSQHWSPTITGGNKAAITAMGDAANLSKLAAKKGATEVDLMTQMAQTFFAHLDPSGQETLLAAMEKSLPGDINEAMVAGRTAESQRLQEMLSLMRGGSAASGGAVRAAPGAAGQFAQMILDRINGVAAKNALGPDVERVTQYFSKWSQAALRDGLLRGDPQTADLLSKVAGIPVEHALPYNEMQQLVVQQVQNAWRASTQDAYRLFYFNQNRSFIDRSLNHPFFGIYPVSYMWGKVVPEIVRFVARHPFALIGEKDIRTAIATQAEYDPQFQKMVDDIGGNPLAYLLGYLLPSLPWDAAANYPTWMRNLAAQGEANQALIDKGGKPKPVDLTSPRGPLQGLADYVSPLRGAQQLEKPLKAVMDIFNQPPKKGATVAPVAASTPAATDQPVQATSLGPLLSDQMAQLHAVLSGKAP